jgi:plasmid stabilization system protein ParE
LKVVWAPLALERALEQATYIARDKPGAAEKWLNQLFDVVAQLEDLPELGRVLPELGNPAFRELDFRGYRVIYRLETGQVSVLTVRHGRRLLDVSELSEDG